MEIEKHQKFAEEMVRAQARLFGYILSLVPHRADAEEIFQQSSLTLWENWDRYDQSLDFFPWACGIAHNHVRNFVRKRQRRPICLDADMVEVLADRSRKLQQDDLSRINFLRQCIKELPERNRNAITSFCSGTSVEQIALARDLTSNAVYKLLRRSRALLHTCIKGKLALEGAS